MKHILKTGILSAMAALLLNACDPNEIDDYSLGTAPTIDNLDFTITPHADKPNFVDMVGTSDVGGVIRWSFSDGKTASGDEVKDKLFFLAGTYDITMSVYNQGGMVSKTKSIVVLQDAAPNLIIGGDMSDASKWTIVDLSANNNVNFEIANGKALWTGGNGQWDQMQIYTSFEVEANKRYQIEMKVKGSGANNTWLEVYCDKVAPAGEYSSGGKRLQISTWDGIGTTPFDSYLTAYQKDKKANTGIVTFTESGTVYLVIRCGGNDLGTEGISADDIEVRTLDF